MTAPTFVTARSHLLQRFDTCRTIFMCCDIQEKLRTRIHNFDAAVDVSNAMAKMHNAFTPKYATFVATEQYPQGVGHLVQEIKLPPNTPVFAKDQPSMVVPEMLPYLEGDVARGILPVQQAVLWGHETHVCIMHTADELVRRNIHVAVLVDGCASQQRLDHDVALMEMAKWDNLALTTTVSLLLQLTRGDRAVMGPLMHILKQKRADPPRFPSTAAPDRKSMKE